MIVFRSQLGAHTYVFSNLVVIFARTSLPVLHLASKAPEHVRFRRWAAVGQGLLDVVRLQAVAQSDHFETGRLSLSTRVLRAGSKNDLYEKTTLNNRGLKGRVYYMCVLRHEYIYHVYIYMYQYKI